MTTDTDGDMPGLSLPSVRRRRSAGTAPRQRRRLQIWVRPIGTFRAVPHLDMAERLVTALRLRPVGQRCPESRFPHGGASRSLGVVRAYSLRRFLCPRPVQGSAGYRANARVTLR